MKAGYRYDVKTCFWCGHPVHYNWYIRHRRSGCVCGIVTAPSNRGVQPTAELAGSEPIAADPTTERQPAATDA
jgi:hypothetical protein